MKHVFSIHKLFIYEIPLLAFSKHQQAESIQTIKESYLAEDASIECMAKSIFCCRRHLEALD
jgi:hypothetical protein